MIYQKKCINCNIYFNPKTKIQKYCCHPCQLIWLNKNISKGKFTKGHKIQPKRLDDHVNKKNIKRPSIKSLRKIIMKFCCICNSIDKLNMHHIDNNFLNNSMENLCCLCSVCHRYIHNLSIKKQKIISPSQIKFIEKI